MVCLVLSVALCIVGDIKIEGYYVRYSMSKENYRARPEINPVQIRLNFNCHLLFQLGTCVINTQPYSMYEHLKCSHLKSDKIPTIWTYFQQDLLICSVIVSKKVILKFIIKLKLLLNFAKASYDGTTHLKHGKR